MRSWLARSTSGDPEWEIARSVSVEPARGGGKGDDVQPGPADVVGVATAARHPSGWFLSARHRSRLSDEELENFRHFAAVRFYLLLKDGPGAGTWVPDAGGQFRATLVATPLLEAEIPDEVPASWSVPW